MLTVNQAAEVLRVQPRTVRARIARGEIRSCKVGSVHRIRTSELDRFIDSGGKAPSLGTGRAARRHFD